MRLRSVALLVIAAKEVAIGEEVSFDLTLRDSVAQTVRLELENLPEGWSASFRGDGRVVQAAYVDPAQEATVELQITPAQGTAAGGAACSSRLSWSRPRVSNNRNLWRARVRPGRGWPSYLLRRGLAVAGTGLFDHLPPDGGTGGDRGRAVHHDLLGNYCQYPDQGSAASAEWRS